MSALGINAREGIGRTLDLLLVAAVLIALWQAVYAMSGGVAITPPLETVRFLGTLFASAVFWGHVEATGLALLYSLVISSLAGVSIGLLLGAHRFSGDVAEPLLTALYTIPKVTLYPLVLLVFGLGISAKVAFGVMHGIIPVVLFTMGATRAINPVLLKTARVLALSPLATAASILVPAVMPEIVTGLRIGFSLTLLGVLIGEMFASQRGLGFLIVNGVNTQDVRTTTAVILFLVLFAVAVNGVLLWIDHRFHQRR